MSTREQFIYKPNSWVYSPKKLPICSGSGATLSLKTAYSTTIAADNATFFTNIAYYGATASITVADTYVTVCDITGAGLMFTAVLPTHSAAYTPTLKITLDGVVYTITTSATLDSPDRLVVGATTMGVVATATTGSSTANGSQDPGFFAVAKGGYYYFSTGPMGVPTPYACLANQLPALRFNSSLKVEMKASLLSATAVHKQCAVTYALDN